MESKQKPKKPVYSANTPVNGKRVEATSAHQKRTGWFLIKKNWEKLNAR